MPRSDGSDYFVSLSGQALCQVAKELPKLIKAREYKLSDY